MYIYSMLDFVSSFHKDWIRIAYSFLGNKENAEDVVQDVYVLLHRYKVKKEKIMYKDDINRFFMYRTIKNECLQFLRRHKNTISLEKEHLKNYEYVDESLDAYNRLIGKVDKEVETWDYYDKTIFEIYMYSGLSYRDIAYGTEKKARLISNRKFLGENQVKTGNNISVSTMFETIKKCRLKLVEKFGEDFEDYFNNDLDKI